MTDNYLDEFGKLLMSFVRDQVVHQLEGEINQKFKNDISKKISLIVNDQKIDCNQKITQLVPFAVDYTLHYSLWLLEDTNRFQLIYKSEDGTSVDLNSISDGLSGEILGEDGWISRFSTERKVNY